MREIVHIQAGQCGNQIGAKVSIDMLSNILTTQFHRLYNVCVQVRRVTVCIYNIMEFTRNYILHSLKQHKHRRSVKLLHSLTKL